MNPLVKSAKAVGKTLKVPVLGSGNESIVFTKLENESVNRQLIEQLNILGLRLVKDEGDEEAGLLTFVTLQFKIKTKSSIARQFKVLPAYIVVIIAALIVVYYINI